VSALEPSFYSLFDLAPQFVRCMYAIVAAIVGLVKILDKSPAPTFTSRHS
jgi:hypothetical protein